MKNHGRLFRLTAKELAMIASFFCRMTNELRQLIKQRNRLQAQILNGQKTAEVEKKFKKIRNKITKLAKTLKGKSFSISYC